MLSTCRLGKQFPDWDSIVCRMPSDWEVPPPHLPHQCMKVRYSHVGILINQPLTEDGGRNLWQNLQYKRIKCFSLEMEQTSFSHQLKYLTLSLKFLAKKS